jgi:hypothetical protein
MKGITLYAARIGEEMKIRNWYETIATCLSWFSDAASPEFHYTFPLSAGVCIVSKQHSTVLKNSNSHRIFSFSTICTTALYISCILFCIILPPSTHLRLYFRPFFVESNLIKCYIRTIYPVSKYGISFCFKARKNNIFKMVTFSTKLPPFSRCHTLKIVWYTDTLLPDNTASRPRGPGREHPKSY